MPAKIGTEAIGVERCVSCEAMIDAQSIIVASAATQQLGNEAAIWRRYITLDNPCGQSDYPHYRLSI